MNRMIKAGIITFTLVFAVNAHAWAWMTGAQASAAASSGGGFSTGSFSCGSSARSSAGSGSSGYSSGTTAVIGSSGVSYSTPSYSSTGSTTYTAGTSGVTSSVYSSAASAIGSYAGTAVSTATSLVTSGVSSLASAVTALGTSATNTNTYTGTSSTGTSGYVQLSGSAGTELASQIRSDLSTSSFMEQDSFANSALINSDGITAQASRAAYFAEVAAEPVISAEEYRSNTAAAYIAASTDSNGVVVCSGASGENLAQGIVRPNTSTDGGVTLAHESDWTVSSFGNNAFFATYNTPQEARAAYSASSSTTTAAAAQSRSTATRALYDIPESVATDSTYYAGGWFPVLADYDAASGTWGNVLDQDKRNPYGLFTTQVTDPLQATITPDQE